MKTPLQTLRHVFGYPAFRGEQGKIIRQLMGGGNALVLMPTGGGKSLCYQIPAILRQGVGVVISPLVALMQDQVDALKKLGVRAAFLNSTLSKQLILETEQLVMHRGLDLLYVSPERALNVSFASILDELHQKGDLALFAIDEAHCISQWGHDFRKDYLRLAELPERYPDVPRIALTATADDKTRQEITSKLRLDDAPAFISSFDRPNISYSVVVRQDGRRQLLRFLGGHQHETGIVYCLTRDEVEQITLWLCRQGINALPYHAGLSPSERVKNQNTFLRKKGIVMVATNAFGMGIDKPDVRFVAHLGIPKSVEAYYQETGRAGRDGLPAEAWMCYGLNDAMVHRQRIDDSECNPRRKRVEGMKLDAMVNWCQTAGCRRVQILEYFGEKSSACGNCDNCLVPSAPVVEQEFQFNGSPTANQVIAANEPRLEMLHTWRRDIARATQVPPFYVLSNRTLYLLSVSCISTATELSLVSGVGKVKAKKYGRTLLPLLK